MMKYTKQLFKMVDQLRESGLTVNYIDAGAMTSNGYYFETSSLTNIYKHNKLVKQFKAPTSAIEYLQGI